MINVIKKAVNEQVAPKDQNLFIECLTKKLEGTIYPYYTDVVTKYGDILNLLINYVEDANATEGININYLCAILRREYAHT